MSHRILSLLLAVSLVPAGAALAAERKPTPRHEDQAMVARPEPKPTPQKPFYWAQRPFVSPDVDGPASANGS